MQFVVTNRLKAHGTDDSERKKVNGKETVTFSNKTGTTHLNFVETIPVVYACIHPSVPDLI